MLRKCKQKVSLFLSNLACKCYIWARDLYPEEKENCKASPSNVQCAPSLGLGLSDCRNLFVPAKHRQVQVGNGYVIDVRCNGKHAISVNYSVTSAEVTEIFEAEEPLYDGSDDTGR